MGRHWLRRIRPKRYRSYAGSRTYGNSGSKRGIYYRKGFLDVRKNPNWGSTRTVPGEYPSKMMIKLRCENIVDFTVTAALGKAVAIRINSPYDPYYPTGGGTPSGFTHWASIYSKYLCYGSKHDVTFTAYTNDNSTARVGLGLLNSADTIPPTPNDYGDWMTETKGCQSALIPQKVYEDTNGLPIKRFKKYCSVKNIEGLSSLTTNDINYTSVVSGNPLLQPLLYLLLGQGNNATITGNFRCNLVSTYYTMFYLPKTANTVDN